MINPSTCRSYSRVWPAVLTFYILDGLTYFSAAFPSPSSHFSKVPIVDSLCFRPHVKSFFCFFFSWQQLGWENSKTWGSKIWCKEQNEKIKIRFIWWKKRKQSENCQKQYCQLRTKSFTPLGNKQLSCDCVFLTVCPCKWEWSFYLVV